MATPTERVENAEKLLERARTYTANSPVRLALLTEAQVEIMLAHAQAPAVLQIPEGLELSPEQMKELANSRLIVTDSPQVEFQPAPTVKPPAKPRRTRKATPAKENDK